MGIMQIRAYATPDDFAWQLACLNDRLMNRAKYVAFGEDVDATITHLQRWIIEHDNCHPKRETVQAV